MDDLNVEMELMHALQDVQNICMERGIPYVINLRTEDEVTRDKYGSIKKRGTAFDTITGRTYPFQLNATDEQKREAGLREETQAMIYTPMQDWIDAGYNFKRLSDIDLIRGTVIIDETVYEIKDKNMNSQFFNTFLYIVLGISRR